MGDPSNLISYCYKIARQDTTSEDDTVGRNTLFRYQFSQIRTKFTKKLFEQCATNNAFGKLISLDALGFILFGEFFASIAFCFV